MRWAAGVGVLYGLCLLVSCASGSGGFGPERLRIERRADGPNILILMPESMSAQQAYQGLNEELGRDYNLIPHVVDSELATSELVELIERDTPRALVLMNNKVLRVYRRYRAIAPPRQRDIPAVAVLTSFLRETAGGLDNLTGIVYEVPLVTSLVNLRAILDQPIQRIGVVYRPLFKDFVEEQRKMSSTEGFQLIPIAVSGDDEFEVRRALTKLTRRVDAIWVLNDNRLLKRNMLLEGWLPGLAGNRAPVIVNARSLVSREVSFGTFAVIPDHRALGVQAAQLISNLAENEWQVSAAGQFEYPISVQKVLDMKFARRNLELKPGQLETIDQLVE